MVLGLCLYSSTEEQGIFVETLLAMFSNRFPNLKRGRKEVTSVFKNAVFDFGLKNSNIELDIIPKQTNLGR